MYELRWLKPAECISSNLGRFKTKEEARKAIDLWWEYNNFTPPYVREYDIVPSEVTAYDYGRHDAHYEISEVHPSSSEGYLYIEYILRTDSIIVKTMTKDELVKGVKINPGKFFEVGRYRVYFNKKYTREHFDEVMRSLDAAVGKSKKKIQERNSREYTLEGETHVAYFGFDGVTLTEDDDAKELLKDVPSVPISEEDAILKLLFEDILKGSKKGK